MQRPMRCVALEPFFGKRNTRQFVSGGMAGNLILSEKGWLGQKDVTLHSGEGPIWAVEWRGTFIAWASDAGVRIFDTATSQRITFISRAEDSPRADLFKCNLRWRDDRTLLIAWADVIKVAVVKERESKRAVPGLPSATELYVEVSAIFQVDCMISGIAPYGKNGDLLVLAYTTEEDDDDEAEDLSTQRRKAGSRPELRIISPDGEELSSDAISLRNYDRFQCRDYSLCPSGDGQSFLVVSPEDIVVAQTRDESDHIVWLIEMQRYEEALHALEKSGLGTVGGFDVTDVGKKYLEFLVEEGESQFPPVCPHRADSIILQVSMTRPPLLVRRSWASTRSCGRTGSSSSPRKAISRCVSPFRFVRYALTQTNSADDHPLRPHARPSTQPARLRDDLGALPAA